MPTIGQQTTRKVYKLTDTMIFAATGAVGIAQIIADRLSSGWKQGEFKNTSSPEQMMLKLGTAISQTVMPFLQSGVSVQQVAGNANGSLCKSMVAMDVKGTPCLFQFDYNGAPERSTEHLPFVSLGSGQPIADPFLAFLKRLIWSGVQPTVAEGKLVAVWTIDHVCKTNPGGVGGAVQLMVLPAKGTVLELSDAEGAEHKQQAAAAEQALVRHLRPDTATQEAVPPLPQPPTA
ncbi:Proteasome subunit [Methylibium sp. T29]|nr:Proteasome subunit [Methylibium sp. T29]